MNTIEKIRAEIERLYNDKSYSEDRWDMGYDCACEDMMSFLSTLESEKPMNLDLEIEIEDYVEQKWQFIEDLNAAVPVYLYDMTLDELKDCARHFAQWGAEHSGSSEIPNDLEEAANEFANQDCVTFISRKKGFIAGAKWQAEKCDEETSKLLYAERQTAYIHGWDDHKEQMLKEAVEGTIDYVYDEKGDVYKAIRLDWLVGDFGDKVRIIIVKED